MQPKTLLPSSQDGPSKVDTGYAMVVFFKEAQQAVDSSVTGQVAVKCTDCPVLERVCTSCRRQGRGF